MVVVMNRLSAPAEFAGRIEQGFAHAAPGMRDVPGFVGFRLLHMREQPDEQALYIAETTWQDQASYEAWARSDAFARAHGGGRGGGSPLTATLETFEVVDAQHLDPKAP
jgi:heme-degrading monooxygenase HmoA